MTNLGTANYFQDLRTMCHNQLIRHLESHNTQQYGFRKKRSTEIATVLFLDEIHKAMDRGNLTGALFVDLS